MATPQLINQLCPKCNGQLQISYSKKKRQEFIGCSNWRSGCRYTAHISTLQRKDPIVRPDDFAINTFIPTLEQQNIIDFIKTSVKSLIVNALAGTGKTSVILRAVKELIDSGYSGKILITSFSRSVIDEITGKTPDCIDVRTMHSLGNALMHSFNKNAKLNKDKLKEVCSVVIGPLKEVKKGEKLTKDDQELNNTLKAYYNYVSEIVTFLKKNDLDATEENIDAMIEFYGISIDIDYPDYIKHSIEVFERSVSLNRKEYDFDDMIHFVNINNINPSNKYDIVIVDEAQDLSAMQRSFLLRFVKPNGRVIAIGDPNQAIFGFSGSTVDSIDKLEQRLSNVVQLPLTINQRCAKEIINIAQEIVPSIKSADNAINGDVIIYNKLNIDVIESGDMVLARRNSVLVKAAYLLVKEGKKVYFYGDSIASDIASAINAVNHQNDLDMLVELMTQRALMLKGKYKNKMIYNNFLDRLDTVKELIGVNKSIIDVKTLIKELFQLFDNKSAIGAVKLLNGHIAKGLENNRCHIIDYDRSIIECEKDWQQQQERNLLYVMLTRAKETLHIHKTM